MSEVEFDCEKCIYHENVDYRIEYCHITRDIAGNLKCVNFKESEEENEERQNN